MRACLFVLLVLALPFTAHAQVGGSTIPEHDDRVERALDADTWNYEIDSDGDFRMIVSFSDEDRSQLVYVISRTYEVDGLEIREVWSPGYKPGSSTGPLPASIAQWALDKSWDLTLGSLAASPSGTVYFVAKIDADASSDVLSSVIRAAASTADELEKEKMTGDDL